MAATPSAEVVAIGDELLSGETVDTNSSHIDGVLEAYGLSVLRHQTVPDDVDEIADAVRQAAARSNVVITTGGLGPTQDDLTFEGVAAAMGVGLQTHAPTLARLKARFERAGRSLTENNLRQTRLPVGADVLENERGTAPGLSVRLGASALFVLPGVPREMKWLLDHQVLPRLPPGRPQLRKTISVAGIGESALENELKPIISAHDDIRFGFRTKLFENHVKLFAQGGKAREQLERAEEAVRAHLGPRVFSQKGKSLEAVTVAALTRLDQTVATAESCTGGLISKLLTDVPGSSEVVVGGIVAYANEVKESLLGVPSTVIAEHGAVSEPVARSMAEGVRARLGSTWALSTTGVAGPGGGTPEKPIGLVWFGMCGPQGTKAWKMFLPGRSREVVRMVSAQAALDCLRRALLSEA